MENDPGSLIRRLLEELQANKSPDRQAFDLASKLSPDLVLDEHFLQLFLNAEPSGPASAAQRLMSHFSHKLELWGADKLCKYLALSDLTSDDLEVISSGAIEFLPAKDSTEKSVLLINFWKLNKCKSKNSLVRRMIGRLFII